MSGRSIIAAKWRATMSRLGPTLPDRPMRCATFMPRTECGPARAATIAREDAARSAAGRPPQGVLNHLARSCKFRERGLPPLDDFSTGNDAPQPGTPPRRAVNGKSPP